jgi:uncharacterized membrane protein (UPF0127 family)
MFFETLALVLSVATAAPAAVPTPQSLPVITLHAPAAALRAQIARTEAQRERGLMGVASLKPHTGMLFVFDKDAPVGFWMKDTLIPLDMVFIAADGRVTSVAADVPVVPLDTPDSAIPERNGEGKYVLELPAGEAAHDGLRRGARIGGIPLP